MTDGGSDELFAGYSFLLNLSEEELELELEKLWEVMHFSSIPLARELGLEVWLPFLDQEFKSFAMMVSPRYKVRHDGGPTVSGFSVKTSRRGCQARLFGEARSQ